MDFEKCYCQSIQTWNCSNGFKYQFFSKFTKTGSNFIKNFFIITNKVHFIYCENNIFDTKSGADDRMSTSCFRSPFWASMSITANSALDAPVTIAGILFMSGCICNNVLRRSVENNSRRRRLLCPVHALQKDHRRLGEVYIVSLCSTLY